MNWYEKLIAATVLLLYGAGIPILLVIAMAQSDMRPGAWSEIGRYFAVMLIATLITVAGTLYISRRKAAD